jgi:hypothetical protein
MQFSSSGLFQSSSGLFGGAGAPKGGKMNFNHDIIINNDFKKSTNIYP